MKICPDHKQALSVKPSKWGPLWSCPVKGCSVSCWNGPTSTPANACTRHLRSEVHRRFDHLWKGKGTVARKEAFKWLQAVMELSPEQCHIGMFDAEQCGKVLGLLKERR